eukprot:140877_1
MLCLIVSVFTFRSFKTASAIHLLNRPKLYTVICREKQSCVATSTTMASKLATNCCNIGYDVLTICISIADVTTDIIVLIDFYNKDRMTFFAISLIILILAQCAYAIACSVRFNTIDNWR